MSKMELFVTILNNWKPLTIVTKNVILNVTKVLVFLCYLSAMTFPKFVHIPLLLNACISRYLCNPLFSSHMICSFA